MGTPQRIDVRQLDLLLEDLERWALRREKLLVTLDPRAARRIRDMITEVAIARAAFLSGRVLSRAGVLAVITRAEELLEEQEDSSRVRVLTRLMPLTDLDDTAPVRLQRTRQDEEDAAPWRRQHTSRSEDEEDAAPWRRQHTSRSEDEAAPLQLQRMLRSEIAPSRSSQNETAPITPIRREESEPPPPLVPRRMLARVALAPRPAPSPPPTPPRSAWTTLPHAVGELEFTRPELGRKDR